MNFSATPPEVSQEPTPSSTASTSQTGPLAVGIDVGGTNLRAAVVDHAGQVLDVLAQSSALSTEAELEGSIARLVEQHARNYDVSAVGLAVAGFVDPAGETVSFAPHLPWRNAPVAERMRSLLGLPVVLEHDANAAAWGEYRYGAGRGLDTWLYFSVGTGIGAALVHQGEIYRGAFGTAPEFGHITVDPGGRECPCGKKGCLEAYASGSALANDAASLRPNFVHTILGPDAAGPEVLRAARAGDELAQACVQRLTTWLGHGLAVAADLFDPELIVLGGGVAGDADVFLEPVRAEMEQAMVGACHRKKPGLAVSELGPQAGMIGGADLALNRAGT